MFSSHSLFKFSLINSLILLTTACGGGGGDGGGGGTSISTPKVSADSLMEKYDGSTKSASLTADDIYPTLQYLFEGDTDALTLSAATLQSLQANSARSKEVGARASETQNCAYGGSQTISENLNQETGVGKLQVSYNNCDDGSGVLSGRVVTDYNKWDLNSYEPVNFDIYYEDLRYQIGAEFTLLSGVVEVAGASTCEQTTVSNLLLRTDKLSILDSNLSVVTQFCDTIAEKQTISGRIYFSNLGYVDLVTPEPISVDYANNLINGSLQLSSETSEVNIVAKDAVVNIDVDSNRDGIAELDISVPSWYLNDPDYSDLADNDSDGLPNFWEIDYGLDPNVSNEVTDSDLDGFIDLYEFMANTDPTDQYSAPSFHMYINYDSQYGKAFVEASANIEVFINGDISEGLRSLVSSTKVTMPLPSAHSWSIVDTAHGCEIESEEGETLLVCPSLDLANLADYSEQNVLVELAVTFNDETTVQTHLNLDVELPYDNYYLSFNLEPKRSDLAYWVNDTKEGYALDDMVDGFQHQIQLNRDSRSYMDIDKAIVRGVLVSDDSSLSIESVSAAIWGTKCTVNERDFTCFDLESYDYLIVDLSAPSELGTAKLELEVSTVYNPELIRTTTAKVEYSFGRRMTVLQDLINQSDDELIVVEPGSYIGNLTLSRAINLRSNGDVELWLESKEIDYYKYPAVQSDYHLTLDGFEVYLDESNFQVASGLFTNNHFLIRKDYGDGMVVSSGALTFTSNKIENEVDYFYSTLLKSAEQTEINNNLFIFEEDDKATLLNNSEADMSITILNNTFIYVGRIVVGDLQTPAEFKNNIVVNNDFRNYYFDNLNDLNNIIPNGYSENADVDNYFSDSPGVDPEDNYRLLPDSIAIDNGLDLSDSITTDLDGNSRPSGSAFDIGAYEYQH
ncbi:choice-of-anchor Q domain-containing protein [Agarivorans aestuarii]|uniref:Choice-of-anchor Q domain-containing protein n=1 Tax=Agarivorans aestuarii TaxID=1563703 RepID=A0ABU7G3P5_9ALTE|nr:choice-of-anchor Q domain-containing protein [Agarivorans aestuarii]MEE1674013.1 choice-of-anchor Q domain-containing protein [Agarivorans aestuarii]